MGMDDPQQINHTQFKAFYTVAKTGGFTAAAKPLGLTQPAITHHIRELEKHYQVDLFHRNGRRVDLTVTGVELLELSKRYFRIAEEAHNLLNSLNSLQSGALRICLDEMAQAFPITAPFRQKHPHIELTLCPTRNIEDALQDHLMDIALTGNSEETAIQEKLLAKLDTNANRFHYFACRELLKEAADYYGGVIILPLKETLHDRRFISVPLSDASHIKRQEFVSYLKGRSHAPAIKAFFDTVVPENLTG